MRLLEPKLSVQSHANTTGINKSENICFNSNC